MSAQVLLLRGINVGGHRKLPMADLRALLDEFGAGGARTHVQSGNVVCPQSVEADQVAAQIEAQNGFRPAIMDFDADAWRHLVETNPFPVENPKAVHGFFHDGDTVDTDPMQLFLKDNERLSSRPRVLWLFAPDGIGRSKFADRAERLAGHAMTARNWNSIAAITAILDTL